MFYHYLNVGDAELFTVVCTPSGSGRFPTVVIRSPYVDESEALSEEAIVARIASAHRAFLDGGYAVVVQHCRGRGKSSGDCIPYIYEREDGLALQAWIREQSFYNGELYLCGSSYTTSVHLVTAPFADDIKGAVLEVQDSERYNCNYRNGLYKMGLHGGWYVGMYKKKSKLRKSYTADSYKMLPLSDFSRTVFGERAEDFDEILRHPKRDDPFWDTRFGGGETRGAIRHAKIPVLLVTGFYDIYTGGVFDMWRDLDSETRALGALVVHPYDHGCHVENQPVRFEGGAPSEAFGNYRLRWFDYVRGKGEAPFTPGMITYYKLFGDSWCTDGFYDANDSLRFPLGEGEVTYTYNPYAPASFKGGLSTNFGGTAWQDAPSSRYDIISLYTPKFEEDTYIKGRMSAKLRVRSDREDTCFYIRLSLAKPEGDYGLRDDITQISRFEPQYLPGGEVELSFSFDEHAFVVHGGERLRIDISSSSWPNYVPHTNQRGLFSEQTQARPAVNTVCLDASYLEIPVLRE